MSLQQADLAGLLGIGEVFAEQAGDIGQAVAITALAKLLAQLQAQRRQLCGYGGLCGEQAPGLQGMAAVAFRAVKASLALRSRSRSGIQPLRKPSASTRIQSRRVSSTRTLARRRISMMLRAPASGCSRSAVAWVTVAVWAPARAIP